VAESCVRNGSRCRLGRFFPNNEQRAPTLGAMSAAEPAGDSLYAAILVESTPSLVGA
jgi:hypothetical protein